MKIYLIQTDYSDSKNDVIYCGTDLEEGIRRLCKHSTSSWKMYIFLGEEQREVMSK